MDLMVISVEIVLFSITIPWFYVLLRWQFDLYKHYASKHYYEDILAIMGISTEPPYR